MTRNYRIIHQYKIKKYFSTIKILSIMINNMNICINSLALALITTIRNSNFKNHVFLKLTRSKI